MEYKVTDEQKMIADSIDRLLASDYDFQKRCKDLDKKQYFNHDIWKKLAELGLLAMPFSEKFGGFNATIADMNVIMASLGKSLVVEPFAACYIGSMMVYRHASEELKQAYLPEIAQGNKRVIAALPPMCHQFFLSTNNQIMAKQLDDGQWQLSGSTTMTTGAEFATDIIVFATNESSHKIQAFIVPVDKVKLKSFTMIDDTSMSQVAIEGIDVQADTRFECDDTLMTNARVESISLISAEAVAIMQALNLKTKTYLQSREQFGQPLSKFQLLQHRLVEMYVQEELARSMSMTLTHELQQQNNPTVIELAEFTKLKINDYAQYIGEQAVQLHGGMGVSDEMDIAHYFRRLTTIRHQLGDQSYCLAQLMNQYSTR